MPKLGVVTCQILELEFAHVLSNDPDVSEIWVMHDEFSEELTMALENGTHKPVHRVVGVEEFAKTSTHGLVVLVQVLEVGLHSNIPNLTRGVTAAVDKIAPFCGCCASGIWAVRQRADSCGRSFQRSSRAGDASDGTGTSRR